MEPFLDEYELIWLFEAEPKVVESPWYPPYFVFVTERGADKIDPDLKPLSLRWTREGQELLSLLLTGIARLEVVGMEALVCWFEDDHERTVTVQLKPYVRVDASR